MPIKIIKDKSSNELKLQYLAIQVEFLLLKFQNKGKWIFNLKQVIKWSYSYYQSCLSFIP